MILVSGLVLGLLLALACRMDVRLLARVRLEPEWLVLTLFVAQAAIRSGVRGPRAASWVLVAWSLMTLLLVALLLFRNASTPMMPLFALGLALNTLVVLLNHGMPVANVPDLPAAALASGFYHQATQADMALVLADVLPAPGGWLVSLGDLLLFVAGATFVPATVDDSRKKLLT